MTRRDEREAELRGMLRHKPGRRWVRDYFQGAYEGLPPLPPDSPDELIIQAILAKEFPDDPPAGGLHT